MKKTTSTILLLFLVSSVSLSYGQNFELATPKKIELIDAYKNDKEGNDIIYHYLIQNYKPASGKTNIQKLDYDEFQICAFEQSFEYGIRFSTKSCQEAGGIRMILELPKIKEQDVKSWIEKIYEVDFTEIPNEWYKGKNIYGPVGGEAGCYYKLKEQDTKWVIDIFCGC